MSYVQYIHKYHKLYTETKQDRDIENSMILTNDTELKRAVLLSNTVLYYNLDFFQLTKRHTKPFDPNYVVPDLIKDINSIAENPDVYAIDSTSFMYNTKTYKLCEYSEDKPLRKGIVYYNVYYDYIRKKKNLYKYFDINKKDVIFNNTNLVKELQDIHDSIL